MKREDLEDLGGAIILFLFGGVTSILSLRMDLGTFRMAGSGLFPLCLGILLMILSCFFLVRVIVQGKKTGRAEEGSKVPTSGRQLILFFGTMVFATLCFKILGYLLMAFLLMLSLLRILGVKRWAHSIPLSLVTAVISYLLFVQWLQIPLPKGWIGL